MCVDPPPHPVSGGHFRRGRRLSRTHSPSARSLVLAAAIESITLTTCGSGASSSMPFRNRKTYIADEQPFLGFHDEDLVAGSEMEAIQHTLGEDRAHRTPDPLQRLRLRHGSLPRWMRSTKYLQKLYPAVYHGGSAGGQCKQQPLEIILGRLRNGRQREGCATCHSHVLIHSIE